MNTLSYAIKFWSRGAKQAYFLRHEGYLGAVGAFLKRQPRNWGRRGSFDGPLSQQANDLRKGNGHDEGETEIMRHPGDTEEAMMKHPGDVDAIAKAVSEAVIV
jgi:hypothetical protein